MGINNVPTVTRAQMIEIDRRMIAYYGISLLQMMENAGRNLALLSCDMLGGTLQNKRVAVLCGGGNNGGGGMTAARHISNWGGDVQVSLAVPQSALKGAAAHQIHILSAMGLSITDEYPVGDFDLIIDALIGYGLHGTPRGIFARWIDFTNNSEGPILSLDIPSGLDVDTCRASGACVRAHTTLTLALPKAGMLTKGAQEFLGRLFLGDISVPPALLREMGLEMQDFIFTSSIMEIPRNWFV
jgi:NAD(P)H-hydrate epimerase